jgi:hypothetical protein
VFWLQTQKKMTTQISTFGIDSLFSWPSKLKCALQTFGAQALLGEMFHLLVRLGARQLFSESSVGLLPFQSIQRTEPMP